MNLLKMIMISYLDNAITSLDFSPLGTLTASFDTYGVCLISDINTNEYGFHLQMDSINSNLSIHHFSLL